MILKLEGYRIAAETVAFCQAIWILANQRLHFK
uniref:Uncharacterized protein n=1 Tax=Rhizophora mucronata TaxID=61149 RepID=A0A2P2PCI2_RHIMU